MPHSADLQGLRAIAVVFVLLAHSGLPIFSGGFIGVDIFFVLSGYLITGLLIRDVLEHGSIHFTNFYARRLKRLLPALILVIVASYFATTFLLSPFEATAQLSSSPFVPIWGSNIYFFLSSFGYFDELSSKDIFLHTWSLAVEEQFYLIWPVLIILIFKYGSRFANGHSISSYKIFSLFLLTSLISFALSYYWSATDIGAAFYMMPSRIWQFSLGALVYIVVQHCLLSPQTRISIFFRENSFLLLSLGLLLLFFSFLFFDATLVYPGLWALIPSSGAALVILSCLLFKGNKQTILASSILVWIGDRSYSLYLWHWPIFILGFSLGYKNILAPMFVLVLLTLLCSMLSYRFVEYPFWKGRLSHASSFWVIFLSIVLALIVSLGSYRGLVKLEKQVNSDQSLQTVRADLPPIYRAQCDSWYFDSTLRPCLVGSESAEKLVVLVGDSIGVQWFSAIAAIFSEPKWKLVVLTKSACPMVDEDIYYERIGRIYDVCREWRGLVLDYLDKQRPDVTIVGSTSTYDFDDSQWLEGSSEIFDRLSTVSGNVVVIPGTPSLGFDGPGCLSRDNVIIENRCVSSNRVLIVERVTELLHQVADKFPNVHILKVNDLVCPGGDCYAASNNDIVVFRDSQHLTDSFVKSQTATLRERLLKIKKLKGSF